MISVHRIISHLLAITCAFAFVSRTNGVALPYAHSYVRVAGDPIVLVYADEYSVQTIDSVSIRELSGRVHLQHGDVTVWCDKATHYPLANRVVLRGSVKIRQGTLTMYMPEGEYEGVSGIAVGRGGVLVVDKTTQLRAPSGTYNSSTTVVDFEGGVFAEDDSLRMTSDRTRYSRSSGESWVRGDVVIRNKRSPVVLSGDSAYNNPKVGYSCIVGTAILEQVGDAGVKATTPSRDSVPPNDATSNTRGTRNKRERDVKERRKGNVLQPVRPSVDVQPTKLQGIVTDTAQGIGASADTLTIAAQKMESYRREDDEVYEASGSTEIVRRGMAAKSGRCVYEKKREMFLLTSQPCMWSDSLSLQADTVAMFFKENRLRSVDASASAFMCFADSGQSERTQQVSAERIHVEVSEDTVRSVRAVNDAKSLYFMHDNDGPNGASRTLCDSLMLVFHAGQLDTILWRSGVTGEYVPENLVAGGVTRYYLPSYKEGGPRPRKASMALRLQRDIEIRSRESVIRSPETPHVGR